MVEPLEVVLKQSDAPCGDWLVLLYKMGGRIELKSYPKACGEQARYYADCVADFLNAPLWIGGK